MKRKNNKKDKKIFARVDKEFKTVLETWSKKMGVSISGLIEISVTNFINSNMWKAYKCNSCGYQTITDDLNATTTMYHNSETIIIDGNTLSKFDSATCSNCGKKNTKENLDIC